MLARSIVAIGVLSALGATACGAFGPDEEDFKIAKAEYGLANDAFGRGHYREALDHIERSLERDDSNSDAAYLGAMVMMVFCANDESSPDCRYEDAERYLRQALEATPDLRDAKNALGVVLVHRGRADEAITILEPLTKDILYRSPEKAWGNLGWAYLELGRVDDAVAALERSVASQPLFCVGHYRLGLAYEQKGDHAAARQSLTRAVSIEEGGCERLQEAFWARARAQSKLGKQAEMRADLERCREISETTATGRKCSRGVSARD